MLQTEKHLMQLAANGDEKAFTKLFYIYKHKLYNFTLRITESPEIAQDMVQDVFLKMWKDRSTLNCIENFGGFIFKMAQNRAVNAFKRMATETLILSKLQKEISAYEDEASNDLENKEIQQYFHRAVNTLTSQQSLVYKLSREEGMKHNEIAQLLNISPHTVKNHISLALRTIGEYMQKNLKAEYLTIFILLAFVQ